MQFYLKITLVIAILSIIVRGKGGIELKKAKYKYKITANDVYLIMCFAFFYVLSSIQENLLCFRRYWIFRSNTSKDARI